MNEITFTSPTKAQIQNWIDAYDKSKYPVSIYEELVVEQIYNLRKFELMGAWKTGCLRLSELENEYTDKNGFSYKFTERWKKSAPVGYEVWNDISQKQNYIKENIPKHFDKEMPQIVYDLESRKGFGFIWTVFVLHCFYPKIYPLYDQHVYRAYNKIIFNDDRIIKQAPNSWSVYLNYKNFFARLLIETEIPFWELDRALWVYGKKIKQDYNQKNSVSSQIESNSKKDDSLRYSSLEEKWNKGHTLGGKSKIFNWRVDENFNIVINRTINGVIREKTISEKELNYINNYVADDKWTDLANNVEKLKKNVEKEGLGKYLYNNLNWSISDSQLASHICAIFIGLGIWRYNGKKRGIKFIRKEADWKTQMTKKKYYISTN